MRYGFLLLCVIVTSCGGDSKTDAKNDYRANGEVQIQDAANSPGSISGIPTPGESSGNPGCVHNGRWAICSVEKRMRQSGFVSIKIDSVISPRPGFSVNPVGYMLNKSRLELYLYKDAATLQKELTQMDTVRLVPRRSLPSSEPPPVLIHSGNLAALLYTDDATQAERLALAITAGAPQAGSSR